MCTSLTSLSKIAHQLWRDHPFSQRNKTKELVLGVGVGNDREVVVVVVVVVVVGVGGGGQNLKKNGGR